MTGCASSADKARESAEEFLKAFLANDLAGASAMCSEDLGEDFIKAMEDYNSLDESLKEMIHKQCSQLRAGVVSVERLNESDTFKVYYNIIREFPDSAGNCRPQEVISSSLKVVGGKVVSLNR